MESHGGTQSQQELNKLQVSRITPERQSCHLCTWAVPLALSQSPLEENGGFDEMTPQVPFR